MIPLFVAIWISIYTHERRWRLAVYIKWVYLVWTTMSIGFMALCVCIMRARPYNLREKNSFCVHSTWIHTKYAHVCYHTHTAYSYAWPCASMYIYTFTQSEILSHLFTYSVIAINRLSRLLLNNFSFGWLVDCISRVWWDAFVFHLWNWHQTHINTYHIQWNKTILCGDRYCSAKHHPKNSNLVYCF